MVLDKFLSGTLSNIENTAEFFRSKEPYFFGLQFPFNFYWFQFSLYIALNMKLTLTKYRSYWQIYFGGVFMNQM